MQRQHWTLIKIFAAHGHEISSRRHVHSYSFFRTAQQRNCFPTCYFVKYSFEFFAYVICSFPNENSFRLVSFFPSFKRSGDFFCFSRPFFYFTFSTQIEYSWFNTSSISVTQLHPINGQIHWEFESKNLLKTILKSKCKTYEVTKAISRKYFGDYLTALTIPSVKTNARRVTYASGRTCPSFRILIQTDIFCFSIRFAGCFLFTSAP